MVKDIRDFNALYVLGSELRSYKYAKQCFEFIKNNINSGDGLIHDGRNGYYVGDFNYYGDNVYNYDRMTHNINEDNIEDDVDLGSIKELASDALDYIKHEKYDELHCLKVDLTDYNNYIIKLESLGIDGLTCFSDNNKYGMSSCNESDCGVSKDRFWTIRAIWNYYKRVFEGSEKEAGKNNCFYKRDCEEHELNDLCIAFFGDKAMLNKIKKLSQKNNLIDTMITKYCEENNIAIKCNRDCDDKIADMVLKPVSTHAYYVNNQSDSKELQIIDTINLIKVIKFFNKEASVLWIYVYEDDYNKFLSQRKFISYPKDELTEENKVYVRNINAYDDYLIKKYDYVIINDASKVDNMHALMPMSVADHLVLFGEIIDKTLISEADGFLDCLVRYSWPEALDKTDYETEKVERGKLNGIVHALPMYYVEKRNNFMKTWESLLAKNRPDYGLNTDYETESEYFIDL